MQSPHALSGNALLAKTPSSFLVAIIRYINYIIDVFKLTSDVLYGILTINSDIPGRLIHICGPSMELRSCPVWNRAVPQRA